MWAMAEILEYFCGFGLKLMEYFKISILAHKVTTKVMSEGTCYTGDPNVCVLLFKVTQCNIVLLKGSFFFTNKCSIGCSDIIL